MPRIPTPDDLPAPRVEDVLEPAADLPAPKYRVVCDLPAPRVEDLLEPIADLPAPKYKRAARVESQPRPRLYLDYRDYAMPLTDRPGGVVLLVVVVTVVVASMVALALCLTYL